MKKINDDKMSFIQDILGIKTEMGVEQLRAACECVQLFDTKQQDYGSTNIAACGEMGIAVRLQDKVSRMQNLLRKELKGESSINHETLEGHVQGRGQLRDDRATAQARAMGMNFGGTTRQQCWALPSPCYWATTDQGENLGARVLPVGVALAGKAAAAFF